MPDDIGCSARWKWNDESDVVSLRSRFCAGKDQHGQRQACEHPSKTEPEHTTFFPALFRVVFLQPDDWHTVWSSQSCRHSAALHAVPLKSTLLRGRRKLDRSRTRPRQKPACQEPLFARIARPHSFLPPLREPIIHAAAAGPIGAGGLDGEIGCREETL